MPGYILSFRERDVGGAVVPGSLWLPVGATDVYWTNGLAEIRTLSRGNEVLLLIHGYNNNRQFGRTRLMRYMQKLRAGGFRGIMLAVLWPGDGWAKALTYPFEGRDADDTAAELFKWLDTTLDPTATLSFVAHSLGSRVAMATADLLVRRANRPLGRICLMAPALDNDCLGREGVTCYRAASLAADRIAILASEEDLVLRFAYPLGDLSQTILYGERWGRALGRTGPVERDPEVLAKIETVPLSCPACDVDHGDYLDVKPEPDGPTKARSEDFVSTFLTRSPGSAWPARRGHPQPAHP